MNSQIEIPGMMVARIEDGRITGYTFAPLAAHAGYFGDPIIHLDGDEIADTDFFDLVSNTMSYSQDHKSAFIAVEWEC
jgi:hypothetical protein